MSVINRVCYTIPRKRFGPAPLYPLELQLPAPGGANRSSPLIDLKAMHVNKVSSAATMSVQDPGNASPDSRFRFDAALQGGGYILNLKTTGLSTGTYELTFLATGDPTHHKLAFQVR